MSKITLGAPIIRAALAALEAGFAAHVAVFNAETENLVDLAVPAASQTGYAAGGGYVFGADPIPTVYPFVEVAIIDGQIGPFSLGDAGVGDADHDPRVQVLVWQLGETGELPALYEAALGYARVVIEILAEDGSFGPEAELSGTRPGAASYSVLPPILSNAEDPDRSPRLWRVPIVVELLVEAVERWQ